MYAGSKSGGVVIRQDVYFETTYPKWAFFDSDNIIDKNLDYFNDEEYNALKERPDIKELYNIYTKIHTALKNKEVESIMDMFEERTTEIDLAWNRKKGTNKKALLASLKEEVDNPDNTIVEFIHGKRAFLIEDNLKLIHVPVISFNSESSGSTKFKLIFRREDGKWILTR
jgi:hypothetical protein